MRRTRNISGRNNQRGIVILLVAVVFLFVVGAMAALSIDVVSFYTARSEAQLAADGAALAGARVLANSGMTSNPADTTLAANAQALAIQIAQQVALHNEVGGRNFNLSEITINFPNVGSPAFGTNPQINVQVRRTDIPTFFARMLGNSQVTISATATAEAYNPSGMTAASLTTIPIAPACVKPWLLPNLDPSATSPAPIFDTVNGSILSTTLLGWEDTNPPARLRADCDTNCGPPPPPPPPPTSPPGWYGYYPGDPATSFPPPSAASVACTGGPGFTPSPYQLSIAGCVQTPIACNSSANIDTTSYPNRNAETGPAVNCLAHATAGNGDSVDDTAVPIPPFQFVAGADNPLVQAGTLGAGTNVFVSSSLVTVPVFNSSPWPPATYPSVQIVGFVQLFLEPDGTAVPTTGANSGALRTKVINLAGCGTGATGQPILGNGASTVPVRLISHP